MKILNGYLRLYFAIFRCQIEARIKLLNKTAAPKMQKNRPKAILISYTDRN